MAKSLGIGAATELQVDLNEAAKVLQLASDWSYAMASYAFSMKTIKPVFIFQI